MKKLTQDKILNDTKAIYDAIAPDFSDTRGKWWQPPFGLKEQLREGMKVLDMGCGNGRFAELFRGRKIEYLGIDNSEELIKICRQRFAGESNIKFEVVDVTKLDNDVIIQQYNNCFDLVLLIAVLHHIPTEKLRLKILKDIYGLLSPGGRLIMRNWNFWNFRTAKNYYPRLFNYPYKIRQGAWSIKDAFIPWKPLGRKNLRYVHSFACGELMRLLGQAGFSDIKIYYESYASEKPVSIWQGYNSVAEAVKK